MAKAIKNGNQVRRLYEWHEVQAHYRRFAGLDWAGVTDKLQQLDLGTGKGIVDLASDWSKTTDKPTEWYGASQDSILTRLAHGYDFPAGISGTMIPTESTGYGPAWRWNETDGDYEHEVFLGGEPACFHDRRIEQAKPGIEVNVECSFVCDTKAETVTAYGAWVGAAVAAIEAGGYDVALCLTSTVRNLYRQEEGVTNETAIRVSRFGEPVLSRDYAALFAPGGYRHLIFAAKTIPEIEEDLRCSYGLGTVIHGQGWNVSFDDESRTLEIGCSSMGAEFDAESMTQMLNEISQGF